MRSTDGGFQAVNFGMNGDIPQSSDFDGDGKTDYGIFRPSTGVWYFLRSFDGSFQVNGWGNGGDFPVAAGIAP